MRRFTTRLVRSRYLRVLPLRSSRNMVIYHSLYGNPFAATPRALKLLDAFASPAYASVICKKMDASSNDIDDLQTLGFLQEEGVDERTVLVRLAQERVKSAVDGSLVTILRYFTAYCNFACNYCSVTQLNRMGPKPLIRPKAHFSWEVARLAADKFLSLVRRHGHGRAQIRFFGGEPLLDWPIYRRVIEHTTNQRNRPDLDYYLTTNGSLITSEVAAFLKAHNVTTMVSLDGDQKSHDQFRRYPNGKGTFSAVQAGIEKLRRAGVEVHLDMTMHRANVDRMPEVIEFAKNLGVKDIGVGPMRLIPKGGTSYAAEISQQLEAIVAARQHGKALGVPVLGSWMAFRVMGKAPRAEGTCYANGDEICVNTEGIVFPCYAIPQPIGHVANLSRCFTHPDYRKLVGRIAGTIEECKGCPIEGPCGGGCASDAWAEHGDTNRVARSKCELRCTVAQFLLKESAEGSIEARKKSRGRAN
ncbi:MAG TPA: radical SAM protein [Terriglobia bacterium]|nr:radical SAM protein [Terriglobia bacterium]